MPKKVKPLSLLPPIMTVPWLTRCTMTHKRHCTMTHKMYHDSQDVPWVTKDTVPWLTRCTMTHKRYCTMTHKTLYHDSQDVLWLTKDTVPWLTRRCTMTHKMYHDSQDVPWFTRHCTMTHKMYHDSQEDVSWLTRGCIQLKVLRYRQLAFAFPVYTMDPSILPAKFNIWIIGKQQAKYWQNRKKLSKIVKLRSILVQKIAS